MRPGDPPTRQASDDLFKNLFFTEGRYDLSPVGRMKLNRKLGCPADSGDGTLAKEDIIEILRMLIDLKDGRGEVDDIDNLGNRRVRTVGELVENQFRLGLTRVERAVKEQLSQVDVESLTPQDLINAKPVSAVVREVLSVQPIVAVHGPNQSFVRGYAQAQSNSFGTRWINTGACRI